MVERYKPKAERYRPSGHKTRRVSPMLVERSSAFSSGKITWLEVAPERAAYTQHHVAQVGRASKERGVFNTFIVRWIGGEGSSERAYYLFLTDAEGSKGRYMTSSRVLSALHQFAEEYLSGGVVLPPLPERLRELPVVAKKSGFF